MGGSQEHSSWSPGAYCVGASAQALIHASESGEFPFSFLKPSCGFIYALYCVRQESCTSQKRLLSTSTMVVWSG